MGLTPLIPGQEVEAGRSVLKGSLVYRVPRRQSYTEKPCLTLPGEKRKMNARHADMCLPSQPRKSKFILGPGFEIKTLYCE